jgi:hypothetical protein
MHGVVPSFAVVSVNVFRVPKIFGILAPEK